ncbi:NUDIX hydrolase [Lacticaseibacillus absianus]|uniref:NUDIX hydrolase n=1 Tax=Lacticaseibacillus absianus TaxID=2729623 RepID=UPI0015CD5709|nr:NUDIX hydrolase [Lacticaseibacillus absianus]
MFLTTPGHSGRILSTDTVYTGPIFSVLKQTIDTPDGLRVTRDLIQHAPAVAMLALTVDDQVLVNREYRVGVNRESFALPAGLMEPDETPTAAAMRELAEETGYLAQAVTPLVAIHSSEGMTDELVHLMLVTLDVDQRTARHFDQDEFVTTALVPLDTVITAMRDGRITSAQSVAALSYYMAFIRPTQDEGARRFEKH